MAMITILIVLMTFIMVLSKRINMLINVFAAQSAFLAALSFIEAFRGHTAGLYGVAFMVLLIKAVIIPKMLKEVVAKTKSGENVGLVINPMLSVLCVAVFAYLGWVFSEKVIGLRVPAEITGLGVSLTVMMTGLFLMVFRLKAIAQVTGLLVMENGIFLAAIALCGNMPFFVEIAIFFDIFVCVIILGMFVYRINRLFTHINLDKLNTLKG